MSLSARSWTAVISGFALLFGAACDGDSVSPSDASDDLEMTAAQIASLRSHAEQMVRANPGDPDLKSLVDSTLMVFTAGVRAKRIEIATNLTTEPLYAIGIHRAVARPQGGAFSTWTLVAFDDPAELTYLIEVSGFAQGAGGSAPALVAGTIGDGSGIVNAMLLQVGAGGAVTKWHASAGTVSISSDPAKVACPGFAQTPSLSCALETMHARFTALAPTGSGGAGARQATLPTDGDIPTMRLTYAP